MFESFLKKIGNLILTLPGLAWPFSLIAATLKTSRIYTSMDPVCTKLQDFLQCGYLSREHIPYLFTYKAHSVIRRTLNFRRRL